MDNNYSLLRFLMADTKWIKEKFYQVKGYKWIYGGNYVFGYPSEGAKNTRVVITAHYDSVIEDGKESHDLFYDKRRGMVFGAVRGDDRAGCYAVYKLITETDARPCVVLCDKEESGCKGAQDFIDDYKVNIERFKSPDFMRKALFYMAFDRQGHGQAVYYTSDNGRFKKFIKKNGFKEHEGTSSDVKHFEEQYSKCGVNLSIGYTDQHTEHERLDIGSLRYTINQAAAILKAAAGMDVPFSYNKKAEKWSNYGGKYTSYYPRYDSYGDGYDYAASYPAAEEDTPPARHQAGYLTKWAEKPKKEKNTITTFNTTEWLISCGNHFEQCESCKAYVPATELLAGYRESGLIVCSFCARKMRAGNG